jgi:uncharacterized membrane protein YdjX (TVP38/TMEM64 family)
VPHHVRVGTTSRGVWARAALLVALLVAGVVAALVVDLPDVATVRSWIDGAGGAGWAALVLTVALVLLAPIPRSAVSVLAGMTAGFGAGLAVALSGAMLGALAAFGISRALGRSAVARLAGPRLARMDGLLVERGFLAVLAARLAPVVPFVPFSYAAGLTAVGVGPYLSATAVGLVPSTVVQVGIGASVGVVLPGGTALTALSIVAALAVAALLVVRRRRTIADQAA